MRFLYTTAATQATSMFLVDRFMSNFVLLLAITLVAPTTTIGAQNPEPRIIGGQDAVKGQYPYLVALDSPSGVHTCMGSLVAPDMVLTAAHCK
jgi:secreted trypsin-like serine protease